MENFSPAQYERFEAYRRHALPKQAVRKVRWPNYILSLNRRLITLISRRLSSKLLASKSRSLLRKSSPVSRKSSLVKLLKKVCFSPTPGPPSFKASMLREIQPYLYSSLTPSARVVQARRRETGPLSPDHLREAYRMYQEETGRVGAARPLRSKKLFVR